MTPPWRVRRTRRGRWLVLQLDPLKDIYWPVALASTWLAALAYIHQQHQETP